MYNNLLSYYVYYVLQFIIRMRLSIHYLSTGYLLEIQNIFAIVLQFQQKCYADDVSC